MRAFLCLIGAVAITAATAGPANALTTSLIAAYDTYVPGKGFEIKLVDVGTGRDIAVPGGVNTAADEFHPALSANGRFLVFTRATLQPLLDGTIIPPSERTLVMVDRSTGTVRAPVSGSDGTTESAASIMPTTNGADRLSYARKVQTLPANDQNSDRFFKLATLDPPAFFPAPGNDLTVGMLPEEERLNGVDLLEITGTAFAQRTNARTHAYSISRFHQGTGELRHSRTIFESRPGTAAARDATFSYGDSSNNFPENGHPALRLPDGFAAFDVTVGTPTSRHGQIHTILLPNQSVDSPAPAAINTTTADERAPAWSPDGTKLAFIRTNLSSNARTLLTFDSTPGVQALLNTGTDLGTAPTPQLRKFESVFGGVALATETRQDSVVLACTTACQSALRSAQLGSVTLTPVATTPTKSTGGSKIGIIVAKVTGTTTLLGRKVPKIKPLGRVPLGKAKKGKNSFKWNGRVNGKLLAKGDFLITFRLLTRDDRVRNTSESLRFRVDKKGNVTNVRLQRGMAGG